MEDKPRSCDHPQNRWTGTALVLENEQVAEGTWRIRLKAPSFVPRVRPGQFLMLRLPDRSDPLLGRAFAVYNVRPQSGEIEVLYLVVGKMTHLLTQYQNGQELELTGPLGNGWQVVEEESRPDYMAHRPQSGQEHVIMVAGGIGQTPFYLLAREYGELPVEIRPKMTLLAGAKSVGRLCCLEEFTALGVQVIIATEDGSSGTQGFVTDLIPNVIEKSGIAIPQTKVLCCGPTPMLKAAFQYCEKQNIRCWVSLESAMCCGLGICYGCVIQYLDVNGQWDYRRTCVDGPVFDAYRLKW